MADMEVEKTLSEIRERVRATTAMPHETHVTSSVTPRHAGAVDAPAPEAESAVAATQGRDPFAETTGAARARLQANLATIERSWDKLPPLMSYRQGWLAALELWIKRQIKRATHWYTWEQVNFNASVQHGLRDVSALLSACERQLALHEQQMAAARTQQLAALETLRAEVERRYAALEDKINARSAQLQDLATALGEQLRHEQRERVEHVLDEQRVCLRQLAIEAHETAIFFDRGRRSMESRMEELARSLEDLRGAGAAAGARRSGSSSGMGAGSGDDERAP